jgi:hypothetical protein
MIWLKFHNRGLVLRGKEVYLSRTQYQIATSNYRTRILGEPAQWNKPETAALQNQRFNGDNENHKNQNLFFR